MHKLISFDHNHFIRFLNFYEISEQQNGIKKQIFNQKEFKTLIEDLFTENSGFYEFVSA